MVTEGRYYITNVIKTTDPDTIRPNLPSHISWVGNLYEKTGNVQKYLLMTGTTIVGLPGVFGPLLQSEVDAALEADQATFRGFKIGDLTSWGVLGIQGKSGWISLRGSAGAAGMGLGVVT